MARWALFWLLLIAVTTGGTYWGTNTLVASRSDEPASYAMQPLGELGSPACTQAARALVRAGDGSRADASDQQRADWDHAAQAVLLACGAA